MRIRGKFCAREGRAAPRRDEEDKGREGEVRAREGEANPLSTPHTMI